jgi:hypothetical protein
MPVETPTNAILGHPPIAFTSVAFAAVALATALTAVSSPATAQTAPRTFTVTTASELRTVLRSTARAGDTVLLAPGQYGAVNLDNMRHSGGYVTVRSADPGNRAQFGQLLMRGSSGVSISGIDVQSTLSPVISLSGSNLRLAGNRIRGGTINQDPWDDWQAGMHVRTADTVVLINNDFQDLRVALFIQNTQGLTLRHNNFIHLREGVNVASVTGADISNNLFHSFKPNFGIGEHPDAIQFWNRGETIASSDVKIRNNFLSLGTRGAIHGIFLGTENPALPYSRFEISGNIYYGSALHGISLAAVNDTRVFNNTVVASPWADRNNSRWRSPDGLEGGALTPHIRMGIGTGIQVFRNITTHLSSAGAGRSHFDNIDVWDAQFRVGEPYTNVFEARPTADLPALSEFIPRPGSVAASRGLGVTAVPSVGVRSLHPETALTAGLN